MRVAALALACCLACAAHGRRIQTPRVHRSLRVGANRSSEGLASGRRYRRPSFLRYGALAALLLPLACEGKEDYYNVLGVPRTATQAQLKQAYRKKAKQWHPDKHVDSGDREEATAKFQEIAAAYETLSDPEKRGVYDLGGEDALKHPMPSEERQSSPDAHWRRSSGFRVDPSGFGGGFQRMYTDGSRGFVFQGNPHDFANLFRGFDNLFGDHFGEGRGQWQSQFGEGRGQRQSQFGEGRGQRQGGPLFEASEVSELSSEDYEAQLTSLRRRGHVLLLLYASGGGSCPEACHEIQKEYVKLPALLKGTHVAAVQCKRRTGLCGEVADHFPAVVLFPRGALPEMVVSLGEYQRASVLAKRHDDFLASLKGVQELTFDVIRETGGDFCSGQFCLLLLERGHALGDERRAAREALAAAGKKLENEPVRFFRVDADEYPEIVNAFEDATWSEWLLNLFRQRPAAEVVLLRPRRQRFQPYAGNVTDPEALAAFASETISKGSPLLHKIGETMAVYAS